MISIIIPTYNERKNISRLLGSIIDRVSSEIEIIIVDGGSSDGTVDIVTKFADVVLIHSDKGRAKQLNAGWRASHGQHLFFLHADSILPFGWTSAIFKLIENSYIAATFYVKFDKGGMWYRLYSVLSKATYTVCTYGDQGLIVSRKVFEQLGGYQEIPIMEDYDIIRRLKQLGKVVKLRLPITTSTRKFEKNGVILQQLKNVSILLFYLIGVDPHRLARWYER